MLLSYPVRIPSQMTAAVQQQAGATGQAASAVSAPNETPNEVIQRAFQQGVDYATQQRTLKHAALWWSNFTHC